MANLLLAALLVAGALWWRNLIIGVVAIAAALSGGFALFEAHKRWCVLRAVGIKTKI